MALLVVAVVMVAAADVPVWLSAAATAECDAGLPLREGGGRERSCGGGVEVVHYA